MPMNIRMIRRLCFIVGAGLLLWTTVDFFILAFLTSRLMEGAGILVWMEGYLKALSSSPLSIAGALFVVAGVLLSRAGQGTGDPDL